MKPFVCLALLCLPACIASGVKHLVVFGDSYSDTGNRQRLTNGPLWNEDLAVGWDASLNNFAFSGALCDNKLYSNVSSDTPPSIRDQIEMYYREQMNHDPLETVYAFWVGVSDIQKTIQDHDPKDQNPPDFTKVVDCISQQMRNIRKVFGANRMIVLSVPPLDLLPYFQDPDLKKQWGDASKSFNKLLEKDSILLNQHHSALELDIIHVHTLLRDIVQNPASFGFVNAKDSYWDACQGQCKDKMDSYVWWDKTQLTGGAHRAIANSILLSGSLEPSSFLDENVDVEALLAKKDSIYRSPIYKPKANTGLIEKVMKDIMKEQGDSTANKPVTDNKNEGEDGDEDEDQYDDGYSINHIYLFVIIIAFVCIGFVYFAKTKRTGNLSALSGIIGNRNQGRGRFIPLRNIETEA